MQPNKTIKSLFTLTTASVLCEGKKEHSRDSPESKHDPNMKNTETKNTSTNNTGDECQQQMRRLSCVEREIMKLERQGEKQSV